MSKEHLDVNSLTKDLLKKSLLKPASDDFDDQLMKKIMMAPAPVKPTLNGFILKKAWIFWLFTMLAFLVSLTVFSAVLSSYLKGDISEHLKLTINYVFYGGLALFVPLVLYNFDGLIQLKFEKKKREMMVS